MGVLSEGKLIYSSIQGEDMTALYQLLDSAQHTAFYSYLAINEELSMRIEEAGIGGGEKPRGTEGRGEVSDSDIFILPPSLYEEMGVKGYSGAGSSEATHADFLSQPATPLKAKPKPSLPRKRPDAPDRGLASPSKGEGSPVGFPDRAVQVPPARLRSPLHHGVWSSLNSPMWTAPLPLTLDDRACVNSPRVYLRGEEEKGEVPEGGERGSSEYRLVVYHRQSITLCFIVDTTTTPAPSTTNHPPLSFYDTLESFIHSTLKKLAQALSTAVPSTPGASNTAASLVWGVGLEVGE